MLLDTASNDVVQGDLLHSVDYELNDRLMRVVDKLNAQMGRGTVIFAVQGVKRSWQMKQELRSPRYTTRWNKVMVVRCQSASNPLPLQVIRALKFYSTKALPCMHLRKKYKFE